MCLFPKLIKNPKYKPTKKNNGIIPKCNDERLLYVPIACGNCLECMKKKASEWKIRLNEEIKINKNKIFITLTFSNEKLIELCEKYKTKENNAIATIAVRLFLERYRKENKKSIRHWLITEMGHQGTERIHLHGILWDITKEEVEKFWKYGNIWVGEYVNEKTINYITKYVTKIDKLHKNYKPIILTSPGIGKNYVINNYSKKHKYKTNKTNEKYRLKNGNEINLPIYYRNHLYTEEEREKLWIEKLNKEERWILGNKIDISTEKGNKLFEEILNNAQELNKKLGYGDSSKEWAKKEYNVTKNILILKTWKEKGKNLLNNLKK